MDPRKSYIVQAPAGSGKTELLIRRFLKLLALVDRPEEILAITFTKNASLEMKNRIFSALIHTNESNKNEKSELVMLAKEAMRNSEKKQWNLLKHSYRLRIQTIDSLCYELVKQIPLTARFGGYPPKILDNAEHLYLNASKNTLDHIEQESKWTKDCLKILHWGNTQIDKSQRLISSMLAKRDQWMSKMFTESKESVESIWKDIVNTELQSIHARLSNSIKKEITCLARTAARTIFVVNGRHPLLRCINMDGFPIGDVTHLPEWLGIIELLLTKRGVWRIRVNQTLGFPPNNLILKRRMLSVLEQLSPNTELMSDMSAIRKFPDCQFDKQQWDTMKSMFHVLNLAVSELHLLFTKTNQADYIELAMRAKLSLSKGQYLPNCSRLKHLLVDEFQDTSKIHVDLLSKLTAKWTKNDGRSVFLVGDPMQSIYRFRSADIGQFLESQTKGFGFIELIPILLQTNFRSDPKLVTWFNETFQHIFPICSDIRRGAVHYIPVVSPETGKDNSTGEVTLHCEINRSQIRESEQISELIQSELKNSTRSIGILARSRNHLHGIMAELRKKKLSSKP